MSDYLDVYIYRYNLNHQNTLKVSLTDGELNELSGMSSQKRKKEFIFSRAVLRNLLNSKYKIHNDFKIYKTNNRKPYLKENINFNLSHTEGCIAISISNCSELGIDIEKKSKKNNYESISNKYFSDTEIQYITGHAMEQDKQLAFLKLWTLKESIYKYYGLKFNNENSKFYFDCLNNKIINNPINNEDKLSVFFYDLDNLYLSLSTTCVHQPNFFEIINDGQVFIYNKVGIKNTYFFK